MCMQISRKSRMVAGVLIALSLMVIEVKAQNILRVDRSSTCTTVDDPCVASLSCGETSDWSDAFKYLQDALSQAAICGDIDEIWVAKGTYKPDARSCTVDGDCDGPGGGTCPLGQCLWNLPREQTFQLLDGVGIYGGLVNGDDRRAQCSGGSSNGLACFDVTGDTDCPGGDCVDQRDLITNETTLSGDLNGNDTFVTCTVDSDCTPSYGGKCLSSGNCILKNNMSENSYHVLTYSDASATGVVLDGFTIMGGNADGSGVGITNQGGGLSIRSSSYMCITGGPTIKYCTFKVNSAINHGGAVNDHGLTSKFENCTFKENVSAKAAGLYVHSGSPTITDCTFDGNSTNATPDQGGGLWLGTDLDATCTGSSAPTVTDTTFINNSAKEGGGIWLNNSDPAISNCTFTSNESTGVLAGGSGIWGENATSAMTVNNSTFSGNNAKYSGSSIYLLDSDTIVDNCNFTSNTTCKSGLACGYYGGTIYIKGGTPHIKGSVFDSNMAGYLWGPHSGGALYITNTPKIGDDILTIENCVFIDNSAVAAGGSAIILGTSASSWINCIFTGNSANSGTVGHGGAIYHGSTVDTYFTNCTFSANEAEVNGGGIYVNDSVTIVNCIFLG